MEKGIAIKLIKKGWQEQFTATGDRLDEAVDIYRRLGFEVRTIPVRALKREGCNVCIDDENNETMMIFVRKITDSTDNDLYDDIEKQPSGK